MSTQSVYFWLWPTQHIPRTLSPHSRCLAVFLLDSQNNFTIFEKRKISHFRCVIPYRTSFSCQHADKIRVQYECFAFVSGWIQMCNVVIKGILLFLIAHMPFAHECRCGGRGSKCLRTIADALAKLLMSSNGAVQNRGKCFVAGTRWVIGASGKHEIQCAIKNKQNCLNIRNNRKSS